MSKPIYEPTPSRWDAALQFGNDQLFRRPAPQPDVGGNDWALLAIPDGQTVASNDLDVVVNYNRADINGLSLTSNPVTGLITIEIEGVYDVHTWAEWDNQGAWQNIEGPVFQGGQDYQDIGNGLMMHPAYTGSVAATVQQHKTTFFVADLPQSVNLQVAHFRGVNDDLVNAGLTVVKIGDYPSTSS